MIIVDNLNNFQSNYLYYTDSVDNNIMENSSFIRILYSNKDFTTNGLYFHLPIKNIKYQIINKKVKFFYDVKENETMLNNIYLIENQILENYSIDKEKIFTINKLLNMGTLKSNYETINTTYNFILKISGIWENKNSYGVTYKIIIK